ncbi:hypothetical protein [Bacillus subtilis]|nr:hypothetical protein [Bacillus subtilis]
MSNDIFSSIANNYSEQEFQKVLESAEDQVKSALIVSREVEKNEKN